MAVSDAAYTALATDRMIAYTALTAARTVTLPAASAFPTGTKLLVVDESGACSATNTITVARAGSDTINGATSAVIATAYGYVALESNGSSKWTVVEQPAGGLSGALAPASGGSGVAAKALPFVVTRLGGQRQQRRRHRDRDPAALGLRQIPRLAGHGAQPLHLAHRRQWRALHRGLGRGRAGVLATGALGSHDQRGQLGRQRGRPCAGARRRDVLHRLYRSISASPRRRARRRRSMSRSRSSLTNRLVALPATRSSGCVSSESWHVQQEKGLPGQESGAP